MKYLNPFKISSAFVFRISTKLVGEVIKTKDNDLFNKIEILNMNKRETLISYEISASIQRTQGIYNIDIEYYENRFRNDFFRRMSEVKKDILSLKASTSVKFLSSEYLPK